MITFAVFLVSDAFDKRDIVHSGTVKVGRTEWLKVALTC